MSVIELAPVVKTVEVKRTVADAFRIFTDELALWWPLETHALSPSRDTKATGVAIEPFVGGRVIETAADGREFHWGDVIAWEPPRRFAMTWQLGASREQAGEVEVSFEPAAAGCRVTLVHSGWERLGEKGADLREGYNNGWEKVFCERFAAYANEDK
jgi:hypothetical protein